MVFFICAINIVNGSDALLIEDKGINTENDSLIDIMSDINDYYYNQLELTMPEEEYNLSSLVIPEHRLEYENFNSDLVESVDHDDSSIDPIVGSIDYNQLVNTPYDFSQLATMSQEEISNLLNLLYEEKLECQSHNVDIMTITEANNTINSDNDYDQLVHTPYNFSQLKSIPEEDVNKLLDALPQQIEEIEVLNVEKVSKIDKPKKYQCDQCTEYSSDHPSNVMRHKKTIHLKNKFFKCDECDDFISLSSRGLKVHKNKAHSANN